MQELSTKRRFLINAFSSAGQSVVVAATLFFLYRFLLKTIPTEHIGIWSVIFAATSISKLAEMGVSAGVVKFVATWLARGERRNAAQTVQTAASAVALFIGLVLLLAYITAPLYIGLLVGKDYIQLSLSVLHYALLAFWLGAISSVYQSGLDGCHRMDSRSLLNIGATLLHFCLCLVLAPRYGLAGLGLSQFIQSLLTLIGNIYFLRRALPELGFLPVGWNSERLRELLRYGVNAQVASVSINLLSEPITKAFIANLGGVGGLSFIAYYDMANRMISQFRSIILSAYQAMVPVVSQLHENNREEISSLYQRSFGVMTVIALPLFAAIAGFAPIVSEVWIGRYEYIFVQTSIILAAGWCINTLIVPAYMINLGTGHLRWNTYSHIIIGILNSGLGYLLSLWIGSIGAVMAWSIGLFAGSAFIIKKFHDDYALPYSTIADKNFLLLLLTAGAAGVIVYTAYYQLHLLSSVPPGHTLLLVVSFLCFSLCLLPALWRNPIPRRLISFVGTHLAKR